MLRISGSTVLVATAVATNRRVAVREVETDPKRFEFENGQPTAGFEPATPLFANQAAIEFKSKSSLSVYS
jgi:hypothetical protein